MARKPEKQMRRSVDFWILAAFLVVVFVTGGSARDDVQSLLVLRPLSVLLCGWGLWRLTRDDVASYCWLFLFAGAAFALVAAHLIPLPPSVWTALPGRDFIASADAAAGLGAVWRPLSLVPATTWNALFSLFVPLAALLLTVKLARREQEQLLPLMIGLGILSGMLGLIQISGAPDGSLYLYRVTNEGAAVGLFANRNHASIFLASLIPMLAVFASGGGDPRMARFRFWMAVLGTVMLIPLLLVTGSRSGLLLGGVALVSALFLFRWPRRQVSAMKQRVRYAAAVLGIVVLGGVTMVFARAEAIDRLFASDQTSERRLQIWGPIAEMGWKYFPFGSGFGSFVRVFQIDEPDSVLLPTYVNHAHNDWLELFMTGGVPALLLVGLGVLAYCWRSFRVWIVPRGNADSLRFARLGSVVLLLYGLGSVGDYPLRVPSLMSVAMIAAVWLAGRRDFTELQRENGGVDEHSRLATQST
jgi:O-antigen ligase